MKKILLSTLLAALLGTTAMAENVSTYEYGTLKSLTEVKNALQNNGLQVVGEYDAMQDPNYHIIAYTSPTLQKDASKKDRAFAGVQKVMVAKADKRLVFTNPEYFLHAFLQDDYNEQDAKNLNSKLTTAFGALKASKEALEDDDIAGYHFMMAMPYYEDMIEVAKGENLGEKLEKNAAQNIVFKVQVGDATLYGVAMPTKNGEKYYLSEIEGEKNAAFLPYMVMVQKNEAKIMHPKYYLALSYPNLSMGQFMSISGTPGDIEEYFNSLFK